MYHRQKGFLPRLANLLGLLLPAFYVLLTARFIPDFFQDVFPGGRSPNPMQHFAQLIYFGLALYLWPIAVALLCFSIFPQIRVDEQSINYKYLLFFKGRIHWNEIEKIVIYPNGITVIMISRRGMSFFNGLYINRVHGLLIRLRTPVLFVSSEIEGVQDPIRQISERSGAMVARRT